MNEKHRRTTPAPLPDLISEGNSDSSEVLFRMTRRHANILGAYLSGRAELQPELPQPLRELLDALTLRLVAPTAGRWSDLKKVLDGQSPVTFDAWHKSTPRPRRPYDGGPRWEDLRSDIQPEYAVMGNMDDILLGDADGTTIAEWPKKGNE